MTAVHLVDVVFCHVLLIFTHSSTLCMDMLSTSDKEHARAEGGGRVSGGYTNAAFYKHAFRAPPYGACQQVYGGAQ